jgi:hypothetical protein
MDINDPCPALYSLSVKAEGFLKKPKGRKESGEVNGNGQVDRRGAGCGHDADAKRTKGASGAHEAPDAKNKAAENLEDCLKGLMISQMKETPTPVEEGIMPLLRRCLAASPEGARFVVVAGTMEHYESKQDVDLGWGCGWRNIQMLASYLISEDPDVRDSLFGGAGFVPDIPALQQWLEIAWAKGFDLPGGKYFDWNIKNTNKWIGTTEGAALLRSFGVRARIADFQATGGKRESPSDLRRKVGTEPVVGGDASDHGALDLACIVCGEHKLQDPELRRGHESDSDMCPHCMKQLQDSGNTDKENRSSEEETQITGWHRRGWDDKTGGGGHELGQATVKHQQMVEWVWMYFTGSAAESGLSTSLLLSHRSPLYFQHRGHSQTVVGIERRKVSTSPDSEEVNLLVLDPSQKTLDIVRSLREGRGWERLVKRGLQTLKQTEYQLCYAKRGVAHDRELEELKILTSRSYTY